MRAGRGAVWSNVKTVRCTCSQNERRMLMLKHFGTGAGGQQGQLSNFGAVLKYKGTLC